MMNSNNLLKLIGFHIEKNNETNHQYLKCTKFVLWEESFLTTGSNGNLEIIVLNPMFLLV